MTDEDHRPSLLSQAPQDGEEVLDLVRSASELRRVCEVGCAEGIFTELLVDRCDSLLAVDLSAAAVRRAQERLAQAQSNVERAELQAALERAIARLRVAELARRRGRRRIETPPSEQ